MGILCIRFYIDTERCLLEGVPRLLALGQKMDAPFTFFVNMGRAISFRISQPTERSCAPKLPVRRKLGTKHFLRTALLNPRVGAAHKKKIQDIAKSGHEIGLHGGQNHGFWQKTASTWEPNRTSDEIDWGVHQLQAAGITNIRAFASPGWTQPPQLYRTLASQGFDIIADHHGRGSGHCAPSGDDNPLVSIKTNLLGEPCGVGYLETLRANNLSDDMILHCFQQDLEASEGLAVLYDHPVYAGLQGVQLLGEMIKIARAYGFQLKTFAEIV